MNYILKGKLCSFHSSLPMVSTTPRATIILLYSFADNRYSMSGKYSIGARLKIL
jgi:hypothetical protein